MSILLNQSRRSMQLLLSQRRKSSREIANTETSLPPASNRSKYLKYRYLIVDNQWGKPLEVSAWDLTDQLFTCAGKYFDIHLAREPVTSGRQPGALLQDSVEATGLACKPDVVHHVLSDGAPPHTALDSLYRAPDPHMTWRHGVMEHAEDLWYLTFWNARFGVRRFLPRFLTSRTCILE